MSYNKKTWLARLGQGLNKFSIDGATPVPIINQPDSVTQQGDALSAGNLNDLEQRIADAFDDVEESKADKSTTDALQSQINQQEARLNQHESRLENLEQKAGDYTTVQYRGTDAVPTGKAKNGLVEKIVGKSRAWNQLVLDKNGDTGTLSDVSYSISNGKITLNGTATSDNTIIFNSFNSITIPTGHKVLLVANTSVGKYEYAGRKADNSFDFDRNITSSEIRTIGNTVTQFYSNFRFFAGNVFNNLTIMVPRFYDLTLIFGAGNEPSTVADALAQLPALGAYNAYDAGSLVDTVVSGVRSVGVNIWDEEWEVGRINDTTGVPEAGNNDRIRSKNFISVMPSTAYYWYVGSSGNGVLYYYDTNKNYLGNSGWGVNTNRTTPSNCFFIKFVLNDTYGTSYKNDVQICLNSYADKTIYHPYKTDTLLLSETVTLRSDDELTLETGTIVRKMVLVDLSDYDWTYANPYWFMADGTKKTNFINMVKAFGASAIPNWVSANLEVAKGTQVVGGSKTYAIGQSSDNSMLVNNGSGTTPPSGALIAELATPTTGSIDPILDNFIEVEGGGTIDTIQEQSPVIDNCLDVGYLTV